MSLLADVNPNSVRDRLWIWGNEANNQDAAWNLPGVSRMTAVEAAAYFGVPNVVMVSHRGLPAPPLDRHAIAEGNLIEDCGKYGISIGHRDTDNLVRHNVIRRSGEVGIYFRRHPDGKRDPHRNIFEDNLIVDSGKRGDCVAIDLNGTARDVVLRRNRIVDTRRKYKQRKRIGLRIGAEVEALIVADMSYTGLEKNVIDRRK
jgi:hypothetical protein